MRGWIDSEAPESEICQMADVRSDIAAYEKMQEELEEKHMGKWVLFHDESFVAVFDSFESAATTAVERFGRGPFLIRQVGIRSLSLPASAMYRPVHA
jgi:hypothetical protein